MRICQPHWDRLREAIKAKGLDHLGAQNGEQAFAAVVTSLEGRGAENDFDPLMGSNFMIFNQALRICGMEIMADKADGESQCPICESVRRYEQDWIDGPTNAMLAEAKEKGLV